MGRMATANGVLSRLWIAKRRRRKLKTFVSHPMTYPGMNKIRINSSEASTLPTTSVAVKFRSTYLQTLRKDMQERPSGTGRKTILIALVFAQPRDSGKLLDPCWFSIRRPALARFRLLDLFVIFGFGIDSPQVITGAADITRGTKRSHHRMILIVVLVHAIAADELKIAHMLG